MKIKAKALVEIEVEVDDSLAADFDLQDPDDLDTLFRYELGNRDEIIIEDFLDKAVYTVDEIPEEKSRDELDREEFYREVIRPQLMGA